jgi:hypothetical protein
MGPWHRPARPNSSFRFWHSFWSNFAGPLDADTALEQDNYHEAIFEEFDRNARLGIAGGFVCERVRGKWEQRPGNAMDSVPGSAMFRRVRDQTQVAPAESEH